MVEVFGQVSRSEIVNGTQIMAFTIPAFSVRGARRRALNNARIKGVGSPQVSDVEDLGSTQVPGQNRYSVTVEGDA